MSTIAAGLANRTDDVFRPREGDDCATGTADRPLLSVDEALAACLALAKPIAETERLRLIEATGRILAQPVDAAIALPPFDNAAMDGYAVRLGDLDGDGPWRLAVSGRIAAGDGPRAMPQSGALRILTGAPVPADADAVVMQEHVVRQEETIVVAARPAHGLNIRRRGEDVPEGGRLLPEGRMIGAREAAALASIGIETVTVRRRLRVAMFSTGSELVPLGAPLGAGQIYSSNRYMLRAAMSHPWLEIRDLDVVPDDVGALSDALATAAGQADLVVTTGGVSVGDEDHMASVVRALDGEIHAMRIAMKPGKPLVAGSVGRAVYLGLPGNPVAAFVSWRIIGEALAARLAGLAASPSPWSTVSAGFDLSRRPGRTEYRPARIVATDDAGRPVVELSSPSYSARIALLADADGLAVLPAEAASIAFGTPLRFLPMDRSWPR